MSKKKSYSDAERRDAFLRKIRDIERKQRSERGRKGE
jgi:hypothetical protein